MAIIKDLTRRAQRCENCGNSNIMYFLIKENKRGSYHFHYLYDFSSPRLSVIPHPSEKDIVSIICEDFKDNNSLYELLAFYCWGCAIKGLNKFLILEKFQERKEACHTCNKNSYFIKDKHLGMVKGLENIQTRRR
jgi:hypothetical protein